MKTKLKLLVICHFLSVTSFSAFAQGTVFTYQGRFTDNGTPFTGTAEMQFTLWDAASNGTQVATTTPASAFVSVSNGLFTVPIDFGAAPFNGADRWIQIDARTVIGPFTTLQPRQKVTSAPYAIRAANFNGTLASNQLAGTYGNAVTFSNAGNLFVGTFTGNGAGLTNVNAATIGGFAANEFWKTSGNAGTVAGSNFLGTTDNQPLEVKVNGQRIVRWERQTNAPIFGYVIPNIIAGFESNTVPNGVGGATIAGGGGPQWYGATVPHTISGSFGTIGGGVGNVVQSSVGTIAGGERGNMGYFAYNSFLGGGAWNTVDAPDSTIGGGRYNLIQSNGSASAIGGGWYNTIRTNLSYAAIGGGYGNVIQSNANYTTIAGGFQNTGNASYSTIGGGFVNTSGGSYSTVPGGYANSAIGSYSFAAGTYAQANHNGSFVWADNSTLTGFASTAANQFSVRATGGVRFITAGAGVLMDGMPLSKEYAIPNDANYSNIFNVIHGSTLNFVTTGVIGGVISGGGAGNWFGSRYSNSVLGNFSTVGGGIANKSGSSLGWYATVAGGANNNASGNYNSIGGGVGNQTMDDGATVAGGGGNIASGSRATVPGGQDNTAAGFTSFAAGNRAKANHNGAFVWADSQDADFVSTGNNQFLIRAAGGVGINTPPSAALHVAGAVRFDGDVSLQGGYRRVEMSGGNSLGFLYGSYPYFGDGIHMGYNFYADAAGNPQVINAGGGSSRVTAGYGEVVLGVGSAGFGPNQLRLHANLTGVGIKRTPAANALEVEGNASKTVSGSWLANSDARIKTDVQTVTNALEKLAQVRLVQFHYSDEYRAQHPGIKDRTYLNVLAQEFQKVFPDDVQSSGEKLPGGGDPILQVDTYPLTICSAAAIQELNQKLTAELKRRDAENVELKQRLERLEKIFMEKPGQVAQ